MSDKKIDYSMLSAAALKVELVERKLNTVGTKSELMARLHHSDARRAMGLDVAMECDNGEESSAAQEEGEGGGAAVDEDGIKKEIEITEEMMERMKRHQKPFDPMKAKYDRVRDIRDRTVMVYPIKISDLKEDWFTEVVQKSQQFFVRFFDYECSKCELGNMELRMGTAQEAIDMATNIQEQKPDVQVKRLIFTDVIEKVLTEMKGITEDPKLTTPKKMLVVEDLPSNIKEENLWEIFTEATYLFIPRAVDGKNRGYAYVDYKTEEQCQAADHYFFENIPVFEGKKLFTRPVWLGDGTHVEGMLSQTERDDVYKKLSGLRAKKKEALAAEDAKTVAEISQEITEINSILKRDTFLTKLKTPADKDSQGKRKQVHSQAGSKKKKPSWNPPSLLAKPAINPQSRRGNFQRGGRYEQNFRGGRDSGFDSGRHGFGGPGDFGHSGGPGDFGRGGGPGDFGRSGGPGDFGRSGGGPGGYGGDRPGGIVRGGYDDYDRGVPGDYSRPGGFDSRSESSQVVRGVLHGIGQMLRDDGPPDQLYGRDDNKRFLDDNERFLDDNERFSRGAYFSNREGYGRSGGGNLNRNW